MANKPSPKQTKQTKTPKATPATGAPWDDPKLAPRDRIAAALRTGNREVLARVRAELAK